jgi:Na+/H+-dicarboxylate symporter
VVVVLQSVGVAREGIGIILRIDRRLGMCCTVPNVTGDLSIAACAARGENGDALD